LKIDHVYMCGIVGYLGSENSIPFLLEGLSLLQNRGYDSVGISFIENENTIQTYKYASTTTNNAIAILKENVMTSSVSSVGIGHTRWATHGAKIDINAHPHHDHLDRISLVHNGIIENFQELRSELVKKGYSFRSSTDTEAISILIGSYLDEGLSMTNAIQKAVDKLRGTWALVIIHRDFPNKIWCIRNGSPLLLGIDETFILIASEQIAFQNHIQKYIVLNDHDLIEISYEENVIKYNKCMKHYHRNQKNNDEITDIHPTGYSHWMLKEIEEQPDCIMRAINQGGRIADDATVKLGGLERFRETLLESTHLILLGCGTSYHSGLWSTKLFKSLELFDTVSLYDGADFNICDIPRKGKVVAILISQSGETKDLHRCIQIIQDNNILSIGVVNIVDSFIARETTCGIYLNAGREVAVASTKSFTNQCIILSLIAVWFSQNKGSFLEKRQKIINDIYQLPFQIRNILSQKELFQDLSKRIVSCRSLFVLGKGFEEAAALEGALKIKEVTYIHAEGYSASALKHGPFGLIEPGLPILLLDTSSEFREKIENVYNEIVAREAAVIRISDEEVSGSDLIIDKNRTYGSLLANICLQMISYYCAVEKGFNPDFPRNLAKVVTVE
jgi:glutamine---fructose-6-phosphate transaminase (isomerizing)